MERRDIFNKIGLLHLKWVSLETFWKRNSACNGSKSKETCSLGFSRHHNSFSFRAAFLLLCLLWLFGGADVCRAQVKDITVTVYMLDQNGEKKKQQNVNVYGYYDVSRATAIFKKFKTDMGFQPSPADFDEWAKTDVDGYCSLSLPLNGYLVVRPSFGDPVMVPINKKLDLEVTLKSDAISMTEVSKTARAKRRNRPRPSRRMGNRKVIGPLPYYIFPEEAKSNARMGLAPMVTVLETGDTVKITRPFVKDGEEYDETLLRRTGFDRSRDPLVAYRSPALMRTREEDSLTVKLELYPIQQNYHYRVNATRWFEDFNTVYFTDSVCLDEGYDIEPMRFLEYDLMRVPIQRERYKRTGKIETREDHRVLDLKFVTGEANIDPADSASFAQLAQLKHDLTRYDGILTATIHGSASPDGGRAINERLCRERAQYLRQELRRSAALSGVDVKVTANVATWTDVANLLYADSLKAEAEAVRQIVATVNGEDAQGQKIKQLPCYGLINERALSQLRKVNFEFQYYTRRVKSREEIWEQYQKDPEYRAGKTQLPYEFYELFDMVKDPAEKEVLAKAALKSVQEPDGERPYALAAYELAQCYLNRGVVDTVLLKPYLDWFSIPNKEKIDFEGQSKGWFNDEAIVTTQITMLCKAGDFMMADSIAANLLADDPKFNRLKRFLDCLNGMWNEADVRDTVAASSLWNKIVVYTAQDDPDVDNTFFHKEALTLLSDSTLVNVHDPKVLYMTAVLRYRLEAQNKERKVYPQMHFQFDDFFVPSVADPSVDDYGEPRQDWGYPMVECCQRDSSFVQMALTDGYFNEAYRKAFRQAWEAAKNQPLRAAAATMTEDVSVPADSTASVPGAADVAGTPVAPVTPTSEAAVQPATPETPVPATPATPTTTPATSAAPVTFPENPVPATVPATVPAY